MLVNNFTEFYYKKHTQLELDDFSIENLFDKNRYVAMSQENNKPFMQDFVKTQTFTNFIESAYTELYLSIRPKQKTAITSFQHSLKQILRHSYDSLLNKQWEKISSSLDKFSHPINIPLSDCRVQYELALKNAARKSSHKEVLDHSKIVKMEPIILHRKTTVQNEGENGRKVRQERTRTQMVPPIQVKKSHSPQVKVLHKRQTANLIIEKSSSPMQENRVKQCKENYGHKKAYSPQLCSKKYSSIDYTLHYRKANCSPKPNPRTSFENNRGGSIIGTTIAADKQLAETIIQLQKQNHPSHLSNRITSDSVRGTIEMTRGNSIFEHNACYTPKQKEVKLHYQQSVKDTNNVGQTKSRNKGLCTIGIDTRQLMNSSNRQLKFMSPFLRNLSSGNVNNYVTVNAGAKFRMMLSQEHSKILEEDAEANKSDSPEILKAKTQSNATGDLCSLCTKMKAKDINTGQSRHHNYQATCLNGYGKNMTNKLVAGRGIGISTRIHSHQGDDDVDSFFP
jgi:hypothetical protein